MSHRNEDPKLLDILRSILRRLDRLERPAVRQNDVQLGDIVLSADPTGNRVVVNNRLNETVSYLGDPPDAVFSYSGPLVFDIEDEGITSPPYVTDRATTIREVVLSMNDATLDDVSVFVYSNNGAHQFSATLPMGERVHITPCNIPVQAHTRIWLELQDLGLAAEDAHDLSVIVRFGTPYATSLTTSLM